MHRQKHLLLDIDGVCLDWNTPFVEFLQAKGHVLAKNWQKDYVIEDWINQDTKTVNNLVCEFNQSATHGNLAPFDDAKYFIQIFKKEKFKFTAVTKCGIDPQIVELRKQNLIKAFGPIWEDIHCIAVNKSKSPILKMYKNCWFVEDQASNALQGAKLGHQTFLINRSYNLCDLVQHDLVMRVNSWKQIYQTIKASYN